MIITLRPSKTFLFNLLKKRLSNLNGEIGLDAAAANLKNRYMFATNKYIGLDFDLNGLKNGLVKYQNDQKVFGLFADLSNLDGLETGSVDVIVSTNTLYHLPFDKQPIATRHLCRILSPDGTLILELSNNIFTPEMHKTYANTFKNIEIIYYKNIISQLYERLFEDKGYLGSHTLAGTKPFLALSWLISRTEYLTCRLPSMNKHVLLICSGKKDLTKNSLDLSRLRRIDDRLYSLIAEDTRSASEAASNP